MLYSFPNVKSIIDNALTNKVLLNNYNSLIDWSRIQDKVTPQELQSRFEVIDVVYQHNYYKNLLPTLYDFRDLYDPESVKAINNMYFTNKVVRLTYLQQFKSQIDVILANVLLGVITFFVSQLFETAIYQLVVGGIIGLTSYISMVILFKFDERELIYKFVSKLRTI